MRFVIGRAGTGKTHLCASEIVGHLRATPALQNLLWIVPEQATFMTERLLLTHGARSRATAPTVSGGYGIFGAQVLSFNRLALLLARELGIVADRPMDDLARRVLLEEILRHRRGDLQLFSTVAQRPGFVAKLDTTLRELRQHQHSGDSLRTLLTHPRISADTVISRKLHDLALLLDDYATACTAQHTCDAEMIMHTAALRAHESVMLNPMTPATIWIDGLSSLSALELRFALALAQHARQVTFTLLADPDSAAITDLRASDPYENLSVFTRSEKLHRRLIDDAARHKVRIDASVFLRTQHRFEQPELRTLERHLAGAAVRPSAGEASAPLDAATEIPAVTTWECSDPETEVRGAAQWIQARVTSAGESALRYRDIGLIVPQIDTYEDEIRRIFAQHRIPHFIDQRKNIAHHPVVELLRSAVAILAEAGGWERDDIFVYLKTGLAGITVAETALVENYVLRHGINRTPWDRPWVWAAPNQLADDAELRTSDDQRLLAEVNAIRQRVWRGLEECVRGVAETPDDAPRFVQLLRDLLTRLDVETQVNVLVEDAHRSASPELAQVHLQAWRGAEDILALLENLLAGKKRTRSEFAQLLNTALEGLTLGLIPPTLDQVVISSVARSRVPELQAVLILGAVEGAFPRLVAEDPILNDAQRELLNELGGENIGIDSDRQLLEEPFFDYVALTRARRHLILSYPLADRAAKALRKSQYVGRIRGLLGARAGHESFDAVTFWKVQNLSTVDDLLSGVAAWVRDEVRERRAQTLLESAPASDANPMRGAYNWVVAAQESNIARARGIVWNALRPAAAPSLSPDAVARLYPPAAPLRLSISRLEKFAACPLQYFLHYTLGLRPREELELDTLNMGIFFHRVLERVFTRILEQKILWPTCTEAQLRAVITAEVDATGLEIHAELAERTPGYPLMQARAKRTLGAILESERRRAAAGTMRPVGVEVTFGARSAHPTSSAKALAHLPVLTIQTPAKRTLTLNGKIDRVDSDGTKAVILDYKSASEKILKWPWIHAGMMLQLPAYALVIDELAHLEPAAALFVPLGMSRKSISSLAEVPAPGSDAFYQLLQPSGAINAAALPAMDASAPTSGYSDWFKFAFNKDGSIRANTDGLEPAQFRAVLDFVKNKLAQLADSLAGGTIHPQPYREAQHTACDNCEFTSLCPFDSSRDPFLVLDKKMNKSKFLETLGLPAGPAKKKKKADGAGAREETS